MTTMVAGRFMHRRRSEPNSTGKKQVCLSRTADKSDRFHETLTAYAQHQYPGTEQDQYIGYINAADIAAGSQ